MLQVGRLGNLRYITAGHEEGTPQQKLDRSGLPRCIALANLLPRPVSRFLGIMFSATFITSPGCTFEMSHQLFCGSTDPGSCNYAGA